MCMLSSISSSHPLQLAQHNSPYGCTFPMHNAIVFVLHHRIQPPKCCLRAMRSSTATTTWWCGTTAIHPPTSHATFCAKLPMPEHVSLMHPLRLGASTPELYTQRERRAFLSVSHVFISCARPRLQTRARHNTCAQHCAPACHHMPHVVCQVLYLYLRTPARACVNIIYVVRWRCTRSRRRALFHVAGALLFGSQRRLYIKCACLSARILRIYKLCILYTIV